MNSPDISPRGNGKAYEAPRLEQLGYFHVETRNFCFWNKQFGGHDGLAYDNIQLPVSNCS